MLLFPNSMLFCCITSELYHLQFRIKFNNAVFSFDMSFTSLRVDRQTRPDDHMVAQCDKDPKMIRQPHILWKNTFDKYIFIVFAT